MACYDAFPLPTVVYNWAALDGLAALGTAITAQIGVGLLVAHTLLLLVALAAAVALLLAFAIPHPWLVCGHCQRGSRGNCPVGTKVQIGMGR